MAKSEKGADYDVNILRYQAGKRWAHHSSRNPRGFWNEAKVIDGLYVSHFLDRNSPTFNITSHCFSFATGIII
jgi:hypothetical protein